jgi:hypothetical protein
LQKLLKQTISSNHPDRGGILVVVQAVKDAVDFLVKTRGRPDRRDYGSDADYDIDMQKWMAAVPKSQWQTSEVSIDSGRVMLDSLYRRQTKMLYSRRFLTMFENALFNRLLWSPDTSKAQGETQMTPEQKVLKLEVAELRKTIRSMRAKEAPRRKARTPEEEELWAAASYKEEKPEAAETESPSSSSSKQEDQTTSGEKSDSAGKNDKKQKKKKQEEQE